MDEKPHVVIVMARCSRHRQGFGIRFEEVQSGLWLGTWAFSLQEQTAKKEGYLHSQINGEFGFIDSFPGCPHCHTMNMFKCNCGRVACWDGDRQVVTCPWCNATAELLRGGVESLDAGRDR